MLFFPYRTKFTTNLNKFVKRGQNWKKLTKMKKANIIGGSSKIHLKCSLWFSNFIKYNLSIPQYFKNSIMVQNFTVLFFMTFRLPETGPPYNASSIIAGDVSSTPWKRKGKKKPSPSSCTRFFFFWIFRSFIFFYFFLQLHPSILTFY